MNFKKRLLIVIGIPLTACLILAAGIIFIGSDISSKAQKTSELRLDFVSRLAIADSLASLKKDSEQIKAYNIALENIIPQRDRLVLFPRDLSAEGKLNNLNINITLGQGAAAGTKENLWYTGFRINGSGTLENLVNFIKLLSANRYLINLKGIDFTRENDNFRALMDGQVFSL